MRVGMPVYPGVDVLDVAGPWEMLSWANRAAERPHRVPRRFPD
jgi:putative intracellular protease/amidase